MFVLHALFGVALAATLVLSAKAHAETARGPGTWTTDPQATLLVAPLRRGSLGLSLGRLDGSLGLTRADGLNLSLVGQYPMGESFALEGRLGASYGRAETSVMGANAFGDGLAYGAGLRWNFAPRASATLGWDSQELNFPGSGRETVRATRLGLHLRY